MGLEFGAFEIIGGLLLFICISCSNSPELIGAEMVLPIVKIMFNFKHKESVELASPSILIAVLIKLIVAFRK